MTVHQLEYEATDRFSPLIKAYLSADKELLNFINFQPTAAGISQAIKQRKEFPVNRKLLKKVIDIQYRELEKSPRLSQNIELLEAENTFTVCTAHQPNLMGGYLYFLYKIAHTISLAHTLQKQHPDLNFVPVYYMGSEDNDLKELSVFRFKDKTYHWDTGQTGAVGRMGTEDLGPLLKELFGDLVPNNENREALEEIIRKAYDSGHRMADATRILVNELLGKQGIVVLDPDHSDLKNSFLPVMEKELIEPVSRELVEQTNAELNKHFSPQAFVRDINLFYLNDGLRERIEYRNGHWEVNHTTIRWNREALMHELNNHPERFSPNVILRGMYQETILPNIAFVGGGSEVAYWMQLKALFEHYRIFYPPLILRQSFLLMDETDTRWQHKLNLSDRDLFKTPAELLQEYVFKTTGTPFNLGTEEAAFRKIIDGLKTRAVTIDPTLANASEAVTAKISKQLERLSKKIYRAEKRKHQEKATQFDRFLQTLFPEGSLQERKDSFLAYYLHYGDRLTDLLIEHCCPYGDKFIILKEEATISG